MGETREIAASILVADVVGYSRLAGADEDRTLSRLARVAQRSDRSRDRRASWAHRQAHRRRQPHRVSQRRRRLAGCAIEVQNGMVERNAVVGRSSGRLEFRIGIHLGDVVEEADGDLMGDRRQHRRAPGRDSRARRGAICLSEDAYRQVKGRLDLPVRYLGDPRRTSPSRSGPIRSMLERSPRPSLRRPQRRKNPPPRVFRLWFCRSPILAATSSRIISSTGSPRASRPTFQEYEAPSSSAATLRSPTGQGRRP